MNIRTRNKMEILKSLNSASNTFNITASGGVDSNSNSNSKFQGGTTVLVEQNGSLVKMLCPANSVIEMHSPELHNYLYKISLLPINDVTGEAQYAILAGKYDLWQEIFSHMLILCVNSNNNNTCNSNGTGAGTADDAMFKSSLQRISIDDLINACHIARKFHMYILYEKYSHHLGTMLNTDIIVNCFEIALGRDKDSIEDISSGLGMDISMGSQEQQPLVGAITQLPLPIPMPPNQNNNSNNNSDSNVPASPTAHVPSNFTSSTSAATSIGTSEYYQHKKFDIILAYQCMKYLECNIELAFSKRKPIRQSNLILLLHEMLGIILHS